MGAPRKYSQELQERATRMAMEARQDPDRARGAIARIAGQLDVHPEALRGWFRRAESDVGVRPGTTKVSPGLVELGWRSPPETCRVVSLG